MVRRIVTIDTTDGKSFALSDQILDTPLIDPARPGFKRQRVWLTQSTPAKIDHIEDVDAKSHMLKPPKGGSMFHFYTFPPDKSWISTITAQQVRSYYQALGLLQASLYQDGVKHPYYQKVKSLDLCVVLKGEITLILDKTEVHLKKNDSIVQRGTAHAWSNRSYEECIIAISSHDAKE